MIIVQVCVCVSVCLCVRGRVGKRERELRINVKGDEGMLLTLSRLCL